MVAIGATSSCSYSSAVVLRYWSRRSAPASTLKTTPLCVALSTIVCTMWSGNGLLDLGL